MQRRFKDGYVSVCHQSSKTGMTSYYSQHRSLHLKGDWLAEAGFDTETGVTVKSLEGSLILIAEREEVLELSKEHNQVKEVVRG